MITNTIIITSAIIIIAYITQLTIVIKKMCKSNYYTTKDAFILDLIPWVPYFPISLLVNLYIFTVRGIITINKYVVFSINKLKDLPEK